MRFIRKGGRVIPIRDSGNQKSAKANLRKGNNLANAGAALALGGIIAQDIGTADHKIFFASTAWSAKHAVEAANSFGKHSSQALQHVGEVKKGLKNIAAAKRLSVGGVIAQAAGLGLATWGIAKIHKARKELRGAK